jgi:MoaA/NifB/PqqE/SkfB family radical SAM enzyme
MTSEQVRDILQQGNELGTIEWVYFEGGEPFLYYPLLVNGVDLARSYGFRVGLVSNGYWATNVEDATEWLRPFAGAVEDLSISCDPHHADEQLRAQAEHAISAAETLGIPAGLVSIALPDEMNRGQLPPDRSALRYRGRAAEMLTSTARLHPWEQFTSCPYENLRTPERIHVDAFGYLHICQGITMGNLFRRPLKEVVTAYEPERHSIVGPILRGGPAALVDSDLLKSDYADACHLCFSARKTLRERFPETLAPIQMYEVSD